MIRDDKYGTFKMIFKASQRQLLSAMNTYLGEMYGRENIIYNDKYIIAKGDIPIGLVAHLDMVHAFNKDKELFYDREEQVVWSPQGLGADDRAGVFCIVDILEETGLRPTVILTTDEELGGIGASAIVDDFKAPPCDLKFLIELDRSGVDDSVFYDCDNRKFEDYVNSFGFTTDWGSFSDISFICPQWNVAGVNLSIGYFNEHRLSEYLDVKWMLRTRDKVVDMLVEADFAEHYEYVKARKSSLYYGAVESINREICWGCMDYHDDDLMLEVNGEKYCGDCYAKIFSTCVRCNKEFYNEDGLNIQCYECRNLI